MHRESSKNMHSPTYMCMENPTKNAHMHTESNKKTTTHNPTRTEKMAFEKE